MARKKLNNLNKNNNKAQDIFTRIKSLEASGINIINLAFGAPGFETPKSIRASTQEALKSGQNPVIPLEGSHELRMEICDYIDRTREFRPKLEQILISPSVKSMVFTSLLMICNRGDEIILSDPGKPSYARLAELLGMKVKYMLHSQKKGFKIDLDELEEIITKKTKALILTTPHNPTGNVLTNPEVQRISELAEKNNLHIISDETYNQIIFKGRHISPANIDRAQQDTILLESLSYTFNMAGWGLAFSLASKKNTSTLRSIMADMLPTVPGFIQHAGIEALQNADSIVPGIIDNYKKCCSSLVTGLNQLPGFKCQQPMGGIHAFPNISGTKKTSTKIAEFLLENAGIAVLPGEIFGPQGKDHIRISFATSKENIDEGLMRLDEIF